MSIQPAWLRETVDDVGRTMPKTAAHEGHVVVSRALFVPAACVIIGDDAATCAKQLPGIMMMIMSGCCAGAGLPGSSRT